MRYHIHSVSQSMHLTEGSGASGEIGLGSALTRRLRSARGPHVPLPFRRSTSPRSLATALAAVLALGTLAVAASLTSAGAAQREATGAASILVLTNPDDPFGTYYTEILLAEGLNDYDVAPVGTITSANLASRSVVLLAKTGLTDSQVSTLTRWVTSGGNLIAMRPDALLAPLLGLGSVTGSMANGYLTVDTATAPAPGSSVSRCSSTMSPIAGRSRERRRSHGLRPVRPTRRSTQR